MNRLHIAGIFASLLFISAYAQAEGITLVHLGDSLTEGVGDDEWVDGSVVGYPGRLKALLQSVQADVQTVNLGTSGWGAGEVVNGTSYDDTPATLGRAEGSLNQAMGQGRRALALLWIGSNDLFNTYGWKCDAASSTACAEADVEEYRGYMETIIQRLGATGATVYVALMDDVSKRPCVADPAHTDCMSDVTADELPLLSAQVSRYNDAIRALAIQYDAVLVDLFNTTIFENEANLNEDGVHPNSAGYDAIAAEWYGTVNPEVVCASATYDAATGLAHISNALFQGTIYDVYLKPPFNVTAMGDVSDGCLVKTDATTQQAAIPSALYGGVYYGVELAPPYQIQSATPQ